MAQVLPLQTHRPTALQVPAAPPLHCAFWLQKHAPAPQKKPAGHACPHAPQLAVLVLRLRQPFGVPQQVSPAAHENPPLHEHRSPLPGLRQTSPAAHWLTSQKQRPVAWLQVPFAPGRLHDALLEQPQVLFGRPPPSHTSGFAGAPMVVQSFAQLPQDLSFAEAEVSQPSSGLGEAGTMQLAKPRSHLELHSPAAHDTAAVPFLEQPRPQAPQCRALLVVLASQPVA